MRRFKNSIVLLIWFCGFYVEPVLFAEPKPLHSAVVYRSPTCGCCSKWVKHLRDHQFSVEDIVRDDMAAVKEQFGIPRQLASCHTAVIDGYVVEGHVPADDIMKMLETKPDISGIAVPGMPVGTPGMEMGERRDAYQVISFDKNGDFKVFNSYSAQP